MITYKQDGITYEQTALDLEEPQPEQLSLVFEPYELEADDSKHNIKTETGTVNF